MFDATGRSGPTVLQAMKRSQLSLKWLDAFCTVAQSGSVKEAAKRMGLSTSTVSHHIHELEKSLGVGLFDHARRPMVLTAQGALFLGYAQEAIGLLDKAQAEVILAAPHDLRQLRFAMIEDFDSDIGPEITRLLASTLPNCRFTHYTRFSHEILDLLRNRDIDIGVATEPQFALSEVDAYPLLRDPFVLAVPVKSTLSAEDYVSAKSDLPLLRYNRNQIAGGMIEAHLSRLRLKLENVFELDSTASIMALVAQGNGWAVTTPSNYVRVKQFQSQIQLMPFPYRDFARTISIYLGDEKAKGVAKLVSSAMRSLLSTHAIGPAVEEYPWLKDRFRLIDDAAAIQES